MWWNRIGHLTLESRCSRYREDVTLVRHNTCPSLHDVQFSETFDSLAVGGIESLALSAVEVPRYPSERYETLLCRIRLNLAPCDPTPRRTLDRVTSPQV